MVPSVDLLFSYALSQTDAGVCLILPCEIESASRRTFLFIENMGAAYPELDAQKELIAKVIKEEEDSFLRTLETGIRLLEKTMAVGEDG